MTKKTGGKKKRFPAEVTSRETDSPLENGEVVV
jgi:hypothetical protein